MLLGVVSSNGGTGATRRTDVKCGQCLANAAELWVCGVPAKHSELWVYGVPAKHSAPSREEEQQRAARGGAVRCGAAISCGQPRSAAHQLRNYFGKTA